MALLHGIRLCWEEGLRNTVCYTDSFNTIHLVHHADVFTHHYGNEITTTKKYMDNDWIFQLCHTLREGNMFVDFLVKLKTRSIGDLMTILDPPTEPRLLLMANSMGVSYLRGH